jgi:hypothetical protein
MKIVVDVQGRGLTYQTDLPVKIGDQVEVPIDMFWDPHAPRWIVGNVLALQSDYDGPCKRVIRIVSNG